MFHIRVYSVISSLMHGTSNRRIKTSSFIMQVTVFCVISLVLLMNVVVNFISIKSYKTVAPDRCRHMLSDEVTVCMCVCVCVCVCVCASHTF